MAYRSASRTWKTRAAALGFATLGSLCALPSHAQKKLVVNGYCPDYTSGCSVSSEQAPALSYVHYFSILPPVNGDVSDVYVNQYSGGSTGRVNWIDDMVSDGGRTGMGVLLAVGGAKESGNFVPLASNASATQKFATTIAKFCKDYGLAGVDIDWESPGELAGDFRGFDTFSKTLKSVLGPQKLILSVSVAGNRPDLYGKEALQQYDFVQVMSYDNDWNGGSHSTLAQAQTQLQTYANYGIDKSKIILGVPFYGKMGFGNSKPYYEILAANPGLSPTADESGGYNFNGTATLAAKVNYVADNGYRGIMVWNLPQDAKDFRLLKGIKKAINDHGYVVDQATVSGIRPEVRMRYAIRPWDGQGKVRLHGGPAKLALFSLDGRSLGLTDLAATNGAVALPRASGRVLYRLEDSEGLSTGSAATAR
jgi:spore germination protein YaaH